MASKFTVMCSNTTYLNEEYLNYTGQRAAKTGCVVLNPAHFIPEVMELIKTSDLVIFRPSKIFLRNNREANVQPVVIKSRY